MACACRPAIRGFKRTPASLLVKAFSEMRATVERLAKLYPTFFTILPYERERRLPARKSVVDWLQLVAPQAKLKDVRQQINALRRIKYRAKCILTRQRLSATASPP